MSAVVEVAAGVILRRGGAEFLLAQRPEGKVYAGYWEFPGGKVEAGESVRDALVRELDEELGIQVTECAPWLTRRFTYPHATVRIHFWRVTAWQGEIGVTAPIEHSAVAWQTADGPASVAPVLPANDPILKALSFPTRMLITMAEREGVDACLARLDTALATGLRCVQVRDKTLPAPERRALAEAVVARARRVGAIVLVNDDAELARSVGADGLHCSSATLATLAGRPDFRWVGGACHTADDIARAGDLALDYALLGPVRPTPTHPDAAGLGWPAFAAAIAGTTVPVLALGGMTADDLPAAQAAGAHGVAYMRG